MSKAGIEKALKNAVNSMPVISFEDLVAMPYQKMSGLDKITQQEKHSYQVNPRRFALVAFCLLLMIVPLSGWYMNHKVAAGIITVDVNPGIEIKTNARNQILSVKALNEDARRVLKETDYKGSELENTVDKLMSSLVELQYLNANKNTILITVITKGSTKADTLLSRTVSAIEASLKSQNISPEIMQQIITSNRERSELAKKYQISEGRLSLMLDMLTQNSNLTLDMLAGKTIQQLYEFARDNSIDLSRYMVEGNQKASGDSTKGSTKENNKTEVTGPVANPEKDRFDDREDKNDSELHEDSDDGDNDDEDAKDDHDIGDDKDSGDDQDNDSDRTDQKKDAKDIETDDNNDNEQSDHKESDKVDEKDSEEEARQNDQGNTDDLENQDEVAQGDSGATQENQDSDNEYREDTSDENEDNNDIQLDDDNSKGNTETQDEDDNNSSQDED